MADEVASDVQAPARARRAKPVPRQVAVVDCGTSSVRAFIAELAGAEQRVLEDLHYPIDLTASFTAERLSREAMDGVVAAFEGVTRVAAGYGAPIQRAVATSALRESANSDVLVERLRQRLGVQLEIIDSAEEARLYFEALSRLLRQSEERLRGSAILIDLGGGGACLSLIRRGRLVHSVDEHFGTVRVDAQFRHLRDSTDYCVAVDRYSLGAVKMMLGRLQDQRVEHLVVTGGEIRRLLALLTPGREEPFGSLRAAVVDDWFAGMQALNPVARGEACRTDARQAALLLPAASFVRHLCALTGLDHVRVPRLTLRDGLLADLLPGAHGPHHLDAPSLLAEAQQLVRRYGADAAYAENTASLAVQIFDQTAELHGFDQRHRTLLEFSALVHDIGSFINVRNRHKHTMYIIQAADIAGLSRAEKEMVAQIARYHRRSPPQPHHYAFQGLPRRERVVVASLAAILRLAYGLDVERTQRIRQVRCRVDGDRLLLQVDRRQIALEAWSMEKKAQMFQDVFGLSVQVVPREGE